MRERAGDISLLVNYFLERLNEENTGKFWKEAKTFSPGARNVLINHRWMGNVRELQNTILRVSVLVKEATITETEMRRALFVMKDKNKETILNRLLGDGFNLPDILAEVAGHYLNRAMEEAKQNKTKAAKLVGLPNYQTFDNWLEKYQSKF